MDRRIILAVAGSGKTTFLINSLDLEKRFLIVSYTDNNVAHIRRRIINRYGYMPRNITLLSYFQFIIHVCYRPFLKDRCKAKGITWKMPEEWTRYRTDRLHYMTFNRYLYHNRIAKLCQKSVKDMVRERIEKYYDCFMIDEVQDLGGHDFNLVKSIIPLNIECLFVGDFYQHTFDTSKDGNVHKSLYSNFNEYKREWANIGITIDENTLSNSFRCSQSICDFVSQHLMIRISSNRHDTTTISFVNNQADADTLFQDNSKIKLFYSEANKYHCYAENWGKSKGLDGFQDVCVVLNTTTLKAYKKDLLSQLPASTLNKLYVACTRAKGNIYFIPCTFLDKYKQ